MNKAAITSRLRELRGKRSRISVANAIGVSKQAIWMYETGQRIPTDDIKIRLANYYGVSVQSLFFDSTNESDTA